MPTEDDSYDQELGQWLFGNEYCDHEMPQYSIALFTYILREVSRVYWNINQEEWDTYSDPDIPEIEFRPYYWGEDDEIAKLPNFVFDDVEIRWYKYPGRGMSVNKKMSPDEWVAWFDNVITAILNHEKDVRGEY